MGDNPGKPGLIPHTFSGEHALERKAAVKAACVEGLAAYQLAGGVTAHQGNDA
jgi:hypothetical protein